MYCVAKPAALSSYYKKETGARIRSQVLTVRARRLSWVCRHWPAVGTHDTGFSGDDRHSGFELDFQAVYGGVILNGKLL